MNTYGLTFHLIQTPWLFVSARSKNKSSDAAAGVPLDKKQLSNYHKQTLQLDLFTVLAPVSWYNEESLCFGVWFQSKCVCVSEGRG